MDVSNAVRLLAKLKTRIDQLGQVISRKEAKGLRDALENLVDALKQLSGGLTTPLYQYGCAMLGLLELYLAAAGVLLDDRRPDEYADTDQDLLGGQSTQLKERLSEYARVVGKVLR